MLPIFLCLVYVPVILIALVRLPYTNRQHIFLHVGLLNSPWDSSFYSNILSLPSSPPSPRLRLPPAPPPDPPDPSVVPVLALDPPPPALADPNGSNSAHKPMHTLQFHKEYALRVPRLISSYRSKSIVVVILLHVLTHKLRALTRSSYLKTSRVDFLVDWLQACEFSFCASTIEILTSISSGLRFSSYSPTSQAWIAFLLGLELPVSFVAAVRIAMRLLRGNASPDVLSIPQAADPQPQTTNIVFHSDRIALGVGTKQKGFDALAVEGSHAQPDANKVDLESVLQPADPPPQTVTHSSPAGSDVTTVQKVLGDLDAESCPPQLNAGILAVESVPQNQLVDFQPQTANVPSHLDLTASGVETTQEKLGDLDTKGHPQLHAENVDLRPDHSQSPPPYHLLLLDGIPLGRPKADLQLPLEDQILHFRRSINGLCAHHKKLLESGQPILQEPAQSTTIPRRQTLPLLLTHPAEEEKSLHQADTTPLAYSLDSSSESTPSSAAPSAAPLTCHCAKHDPYMLD